MLDMQNLDIIKNWLHLDTEAEAGIYYDNHDKLLVFDKKS
jgi:hypothetical protein